MFESVLQLPTGKNPNSRPTINEIKVIVCAEFGCLPIDIESQRRSSRCIAARHVAMLLCRLLTTASFPQIGRAFCKDHTTVMAAVENLYWLNAPILRLSNEGVSLTNIARYCRDAIEKPGLIKWRERHALDTSARHTA